MNYSGTCDEEKQVFEREVKLQHELKGRFDMRAADWLQSFKGIGKDVASIVTAPMTLRSRVSRNSQHSSTSSVNKAKAIAKEELARLKLKHLEQRQKLEQEEAERKRSFEQEEAERIRRQESERQRERQNMELLRARQEVQEASLERQVFEEELDRGGFIPLQDDFESSRREPRSCAPPVEIVKERRTNEVLIDLPA